MDPLLGKLVAERYRTIALLGRGRLTRVYLARHALVDRLSALEVLDPAEATPERRARFLATAHAQARVAHPNVVEVIDHGEHGDVAFAVMEYVAGDALEQVFARSGPLGPARTIDLGLDVAAALSRAHQVGLVHGQLSPRRVMIVPRHDGRDVAKVRDFAGRTSRQAADDLQALGALAPELTRGQTASVKSDLYALGALLHAAAVGEPPTGQHPSPSLVAQAPLRLVEVITTLLAKAPEDRPRDAFEARDLLRRVWRTLSEEQAAPASRISPLRVVPFDRLAALCQEGWARVSAAVAGHTHPPEVEAARRLVGMVDGAADLATHDAHLLGELDDRSRRTREELGRRIDELALLRSKALGWAGTIAERTDDLARLRSSGEQPIGAVEAMVWEQAALEVTRDDALSEADELGSTIGELEQILSERTAQLTEDRAVLGAQLDGHIAALRALSVECWAALEIAAARVGADLEAPEAR